MTAVFQRELNSYFKGIMGYLFATFLLIFIGIYTMAYNLSGYYANFEYALDSVSFVYLIAVPVLTMRSMAEERKQKTDQLLYSLPIRLSDVVIGKFLAMVAVLAVPTLVMALYPLVLSQFGVVSLPTAYGALLAFFLLGASLISIGLFVSSTTESQVAAAVITLVVMLLLYFISSLSSFVSSSAWASMMALCVCGLIFSVVVYFLTHNSLVALVTAIALCGGLYVLYMISPTVFEGLFGDIMTQLSVFDRFYGFIDGVFDLTAVIYFLSVICVFLFLSVQALEKRRWSE